MARIRKSKSEAEHLPQKTSGLFARKPVRVAFGVLAVGTACVVYELQTSTVQSWIFPKVAQGELFAKTVTTTPPAVGPLDVDRCYDRVPELRQTFAQKDGDTVSQQVPWTRHKFGTMTLPPVFDRPVQSGVRILDMNGQPMYVATTPVEVYKSFDDIPLRLSRALSLVEDQGVLDPNKPHTYNAAVNVPRIANSLVEYAEKKAGLRKGMSGGSTLEIQSVKNEAWKDGQSRTVSDKAEQALMASIEMYKDGPDTRARRRASLARYMNIVSFASHPKTGEVRGFQMGMAVWFGNTDYDEILKSEAETPESAKAFRQALTLVMAVQMPDRILRSRAGFATSQQRLDKFLPVLVREGVITESFGQMVKATKLNFEEVGAAPALPPAPAHDKSVDSLRLSLLSKMRLSPVDGFYKLSRCDLTVDSTLDAAVNAAINTKLRSFNDPEVAKASGLTGERLLRPETAPKVVWAITVNEVLPDGRTLTRVSTDTYKGALDLNKGGKQNFGSTQKFRMMVTYLNVIEKLHAEYANQTPEQLAEVKPHPKDNLTRWAVEYLKDPTTDHALDAMLRAAVKRPYSAALGGFFTGGGMNYPHNFDKKDNGALFPVEQALWQSINLSWFRITDDIEEHMKWHVLKLDPRLTAEGDVPADVAAKRQKLLEDFAIFEGATFLGRAWKAMEGKSPAELPALLAAKTSRRPTPLAVIHFSLHPDADYKSMVEFIAKESSAKPSEKELRKLFDDHAPQRPFDVMPLLKQVKVGGVEETHRLATLIDRTPKPDEPTRSWFSQAEQLAALYGRRHAGAPYEEMRAFIKKHCTDCKAPYDFKAEYARYKDGAYDPAARFYKFDLNDRGYLTRPVHPMMLRLAALKIKKPDLSWSEAQAATRDDRILIYKWLLKSSKKKAQDKAVGIMADQLAWKEIEKFWHSMGYPFKLVPSLATVIGVSGDNTESLTAFQSILLNDGKSVNTTRFTGLHFGVGTPHEMHAKPGQPHSHQVIAPEVARLALEVAEGGVTNPKGTSRRLYQAFKLSDGTVLPVRGKTGTNDESATLGVRGGFWTGSAGRFAITIAGYIYDAKPNDKFTSALATQALKTLAPELQPLFDRAPVELAMPPAQPAPKVEVPALATLPRSWYDKNLAITWDELARHAPPRKMAPAPQAVPSPAM